MINGKTYTYFELLYPLLLSHSNAAANALEKEFGKNFVNIMNKRAQSLGMASTIFADAAGISLENISSAKDLFHFFKYLFGNRHWVLDISKGKIYDDFGPVSFQNAAVSGIFGNIPGLIAATMTEKNENKNNGILIVEVKNGQEKRPVAIMVLGSEDAFGDSQIILGRILENHSLKI